MASGYVRMREKYVRTAPRYGRSIGEKSRIPKRWNPALDIKLMAIHLIMMNGWNLSLNRCVFNMKMIF